MRQEFDRQLATLLERGYHDLAGVDAFEFTHHVEPLRDLVQSLAVPEPDLDAGRLGFVIVVNGHAAPAEQAMALVEREGKPGTTNLRPRAADDFTTVDGVCIPDGVAYLLVGIDRGSGTLNVTPDAALPVITEQGRSPLTIDEGIAIVTHYPEFLQRNNGFSLLASRCGDRRVPAIWITRHASPHLGWCWAANPHTWLGSASCGGRIGI